MKTNIELYQLEFKYGSFSSFFLFIFTFLIVYYYIYLYIYIFIDRFMPFELSNYFIFTELTEIFSIQFYMSLLFTFFFCLPFWILQLWIFFKNGFFKFENQQSLKYIISWLILNLFQSYFFFFFIFPEYNFFYLEMFNIPYENMLHFYYEPQFLNYLLFFFELFLWNFFFFQFLFFLSPWKISRKNYFLIFFFYFFFFLPFNLFWLFNILFILIFMFEFFFFISRLNRDYLLFYYRFKRLDNIMVMYWTANPVMLVQIHL